MIGPVERKLRGYSCTGSSATSGTIARATKLSVFGLDPKTAIHHAASARQLLETGIECNTSG